MNIFIKMTALLSIVLAPSFKLLNPNGEVFPAGSFWIGLIIFILVALTLLVFNFFMLKKYAKNVEMLAESRKRREKLEDRRFPYSPSKSIESEQEPLNDSIQNT